MSLVTTQRHLENIDINKDGKVLVASSSLTGQIWDGGINYMENLCQLKDKLYKSYMSRSMGLGVADAAWCGSDSVVACNDEGAVEISKLEAEFLLEACVLVQHHSYVTTVSVNCDSTLCVSGGGDYFVNVADLKEQKLMRKCGTHSDIVNRVSTHNASPDMFTSCSMDGTVLVYDLRKDKPARRISLPGNTPTAVGYHGDKLAVGTESGELLIKDLRASTSTPLKKTASHCRAIRRAIFSPHSSTHIASCGEDGVVAIVNYDLLDTRSIYRKESHTDFVTGIVWTSDRELVSCSWDSTVYTHSLLNDTEEANHEVLSNGVC